MGMAISHPPQPAEAGHQQVWIKRSRALAAIVEIIPRKGHGNFSLPTSLS